MRRGVVLLAIASTAVAQPTSQGARREIPNRPTRAECIAIHDADYQIIRSLETQLSSCTRAGAAEPFRVISRPINMLPSTAGDCSAGKQELTAWPQCYSRFEPPICQARISRKTRLDTCMSRARHVEAELQRDEADRIERENLLSRYNDAWDKVDEAREAFSNPLSLTKYVADRDSGAGADLKANPNAASEISRFTGRYTDLAIDAASRNSNIKKIQRQSLSRIFSILDRAQQDVASVSNQIASLNGELRRAEASRSAPLPVRNIPSSGSKCDVLANPDSSRALMDRDPDAWAALNDACTR
jgi:hypothetical protein